MSTLASRLKEKHDAEESRRPSAAETESGRRYPARPAGSGRGTEREEAAQKERRVSRSKQDAEQIRGKRRTDAPTPERIDPPSAGKKDQLARTKRPADILSARLKADRQASDPPDGEDASALRPSLREEPPIEEFHGADGETREDVSGTMSKAMRDNVMRVAKRKEEEREAEEESRSTPLPKERRVPKALAAVMIAACLYLVFLIYGVAMTTYRYGANGTIAPQVLSVQDIREQKDFDVIRVQYEKYRILYEKILLLDYRYAQGQEDPLTLAPLYSALLEDESDVNVSDLKLKTDALTVAPKYSEIKTLMLDWLNQDHCVATYLQNKSAGITNSDSTTLGNAAQDQQAIYEKFSILTQNIVSLGQNVKGEDMTDITNWSPESYVDTAINGAQG